MNKKQVIRLILRHIIEIYDLYAGKIWDAEAIGISENATFIEYLKSLFNALLSGEIEIYDIIDADIELMSNDLKELIREMQRRKWKFYFDLGTMNFILGNTEVSIILRDESIKGIQLSIYDGISIRDMLHIVKEW